jgi:hypothetical protein
MTVGHRAVRRALEFGRERIPTAAVFALRSNVRARRRVILTPSTHSEETARLGLQDPIRPVCGGPGANPLREAREASVVPHPLVAPGKHAGSPIGLGKRGRVERAPFRLHDGAEEILTRQVEERAPEMELTPIRGRSVVLVQA